MCGLAIFPNQYPREDIDDGRNALLLDGTDSPQITEEGGVRSPLYLEEDEEDIATVVKGYSFTMSAYPLESLESCKHEFDLEEAKAKEEEEEERVRAEKGLVVGRTYIHLDSHTMGIGGYDSWSPNVASGYHIIPATLTNTTTTISNTTTNSNTNSTNSINSSSMKSQVPAENNHHHNTFITTFTLQYLSSK